MRYKEANWARRKKEIVAKSKTQSNEETWDLKSENEPSGQLFLLDDGIWKQRQKEGVIGQIAGQGRFLQPFFSRITAGKALFRLEPSNFR